MFKVHTFIFLWAMAMGFTLTIILWGLFSGHPSTFENAVFIHDIRN